MPVIAFVARSCLFESFYQHKPMPNLYFHSFNILFFIIAAIMGIFDVKPTIVIAIAGIKKNFN